MICSQRSEVFTVVESKDKPSDIHCLVIYVIARTQTLTFKFGDLKTPMVSWRVLPNKKDSDIKH